MPNPSPIFTKDGKRLIKSRYRKICVGGRKVDEHRWLMEQKLGRRLERWEHVHHKNEDTHDNHIDNLELLPKPEHFKLHRPNFKRVILAGENAGRAKLTNAQVLIIRQRLAQGENCCRLAREFGVDRRRIRGIKHNETYKQAA